MVFLLLAVAASAAVAWMVATGLVGRSTTTTTTEVVEVNTVPISEILIANQEMAMGELLLDTKIGWREWPKANVSEAMITKEEMPDAIAKYGTARARAPIYEGEPIVDKKLIAPGQSGFMSAILTKGMRAISVPISEPTAVAGFILPNDRVDVLLTSNKSIVPGQGRKTVKTVSTVTGAGGTETTEAIEEVDPVAAPVGNTETVITNVRVLAINQVYRQELKEERVTVVEGRMAVLELDPFQAQVITSVFTQGQISLTLRSVNDNGEPGTDAAKPQVAERFTKEQVVETQRVMRIVRNGVETIYPVNE